MFLVKLKASGESSSTSSNDNNNNSNSNSNGDGMWWIKAGKNNPFVCSRCAKAFPTTQALGGHQNAHRKDRLLEERLKKDTAPATSPNQMIDFWANDHPNQLQQHAQYHTAAGSVAVMMRDYMGVAPENRDGGWLVEIPVDNFGSAGTDFGHKLIANKRDDVDLTLKL